MASEALEDAPIRVEDFSERASEAEGRLNVLEEELQRLREGATSSTAEDNTGDSILEELLVLRTQLEAALIEEKEAKHSHLQLKSENDKLKYRIKHLVSALRESDEGASKSVQS
eukprot:TRINITY_DN16280_c0_g1_i1.p1 TRINITY_DN16280_c0_g1~~TRINITY_DN16280_c0_g1_i1.p1  ORF type:complete len:114 (+),score=21.91 TRINITY_DN16280_c0_g1_i1:169-510(+)